MEIFHSYVSLPEGNRSPLYSNHYWSCGCPIFQALPKPRGAVLVDDAIGAALVAVGVADLRNKGSRPPEEAIQIQRVDEGKICQSIKWSSIGEERRILPCIFHGTEVKVDLGPQNPSKLGCSLAPKILSNLSWL